MVAMAPVTYPQKYLGISRNLSTHQGLLEAAGWHCFRIRSRIGTGKAAFETACGRLMAWEMQRHAGLRPLIDDHTVTLHLGPIKHRCFIVHAEQTAESACVSYGTMPGHWESGEESFRVWMEADAVWAECPAFFPATVLGHQSRWPSGAPRTADHGPPLLRRTSHVGLKPPLSPALG